jgi:hypothetical protein
VLVSGVRIIYVQLLHPSTSAKSQATDLYDRSDFDAQQQAQLPVANAYGLDLKARRELPKG